MWETTLPLPTRINIYRKYKTDPENMIKHFREVFTRSSVSMQVKNFISTGYNNNKTCPSKHKKRIDREINC